ncbi:MAG: Ig-like domain-containing protein, partial [Bacteroidota bacterium]
MNKQLLYLFGLLLCQLTMFAQETTSFTYPTENLQILQNTDYTVSVVLEGMKVQREYNIRLGVNGTTLNTTRYDFRSSGADTTINWSTTSFNDLPTSVGNYEMQVGLALEGPGGGEVARDTVSYDIVSTITNQPPNMSIVDPNEGQVFSVGDNVTVNVTATDSDGSILDVLFYYDGAIVFSDNTAPYSYTINNVQAGVHSIRAVATDDDSATAEDIININVQSAGGGTNPLVGTPATLGTRDCEIIEITGAEMCNNLSTELPRDIVGFAWTGNAWTQIPIQIDERRFGDVVQAYGDTTVVTCAQSGVNNNMSIVPYNTLHYCDPNGGAGPDNDLFFDDNDELVFMAKDIGSKSPLSSFPSGVDNMTWCEYEIIDPLTSSLGYVYFFLRTGNLDQAAGKNYVEYDFIFDDGTGTLRDETEYLGFYDECYVGPTIKNTEQSLMKTAYYDVGWSAAWVEDNWTNKNTNVDILEAYEGLLARNNTNRYGDTYSRARHTFAANINGPVRSIRVTMGTNSGTYNELITIAYECYVEHTHNYRVHSPAGGNNDNNFFADFASTMSGATFSSNNESGIFIDAFGGQNESGNVNKDDVSLYELRSHPSNGSLISLFDYSFTNMTEGSSLGGGVDVVFQQYWWDETGGNAWSIGDGNEYGSSGVYVNYSRCLDKRYGSDGCATDTPYAEYSIYRSDWFFPSNESIVTASAQRSYYDNPLQPVFRAEYQAGTPDPNFNNLSNGQNITAGEPFTLVGSATDNNGTITQMELFVNGVSQGVDNSPPYEWTLNLGAGSYDLDLVATDNDGNQTTETITIGAVAAGDEYKVTYKDLQQNVRGNFLLHPNGLIGINPTGTADTIIMGDEIIVTHPDPSNSSQ